MILTCFVLFVMWQRYWSVEIPTYDLVFISSLRSRSIDLIKMDPPHTEWWFFKNFFMRCPPLQLFFPLSTGQRGFHLQDPTFCICKWVCRWLNHSERERAKSSFKRCHSEERVYICTYDYDRVNQEFSTSDHILCPRHVIGELTAYIDGQASLENTSLFKTTNK